MFTKIKAKKFFIIFFLILLISFLGYFGKGAFEYYDWIKTKQAIAAGGFTNLIAGTLGTVTPVCSYSTTGCTCNLCNDCGCNTFSQAIITMGQEVNGAITNLCVSNMLQVKGTPIAMASGKQFIAGSMTGKCLTVNAVLGTASLAATRFEKIAEGFKYIIAGFKEK